MIQVSERFRATAPLAPRYSWARETPQKRPTRRLTSEARASIHRVDPMKRDAHARVTAPAGARHNSVNDKEITIVPKNKLIENRDAACGSEDLPDTAALTGSSEAVSALPSGAPDTPAVGAVWAALSANAGGTTAELAEAAKMSRSSAAKALAALEEAGLVSRTKGGRQGAKLFPDRWRANPAVEPALTGPDELDEAPTTGSGEPVHAQAEVATATEATGGNGAAPGTGVMLKTESSRLRPGGLREMVIGYLREHPDEDFSPTVLGRALARSSGAVANACHRLVSDGADTQTSDKPRRYRSTKGSD